MTQPEFISTVIQVPRHFFCVRCLQLYKSIGEPTPEQWQEPDVVCQRCLDHLQLCETMERLIAALSCRTNEGQQ